MVYKLTRIMLNQLWLMFIFFFYEYFFSKFENIFLSRILFFGRCIYFTSKPIHIKEKNKFENFFLFDFFSSYMKPYIYMNLFKLIKIKDFFKIYYCFFNQYFQKLSFLFRIYLIRAI